MARDFCQNNLSHRWKTDHLWAKDIQNNESVEVSTGYGGRDHLSCLLCMVMPRQE
jgi:hypothetical protein